jgi:hypothetical protein
MSTPSMTLPERPAHARRSDPISSHLTLASLGKDTSLKARVLAAAFRLEERHAVWNDTMLTEMVEHTTRQRQQRNVIARTRDLMTDDGWFEGVGLDEYEGRTLMHYKLTDGAKVAP